MKDGYEALKSLLVNRFRRKKVDESITASAGGIDSLAILAAHEAKPESWAGPLRDALTEVDADQDRDILAVAKAILEQSDPVGAAAGKYRINLQGAQGVLVGDHGQMTVNVGPQLRGHGPNSAGQV